MTFYSPSRYLLFALTVALALTSSMPTYGSQESTEQRLTTLLADIEQHNGETAELTVKLSKFQDTLLAHMESQPDPSTYIAEVEVLEPLIEKFYRYSDFVATRALAEGGASLIEPQVVYVDDEYGYGRLTYLNTFKTGHHLSSDEREYYFSEEYDWYVRDAAIFPFELTPETLEGLTEDTLYIFVMFPDGEIRISLDRADEEYHVRAARNENEQFIYPNHTILAGDPHQGVISAGALLFYEHEGKRLYFISNQSGHFRPTPWSLNSVHRRLRELQTQPDPIVQLSDTDFGQLAVRNFPRIRVPVEMTESLAERLFMRIHDRWMTHHTSQDWEAILGTIAEVGASGLDQEVIDALAEYRAASVIHRSAFHLFDVAHSAPDQFHQYVKLLGKLKDAILHDELAHQRAYARQVLQLIHESDIEFLSTDFRPTCDDEFHKLLRRRCTSIKNLSSHDELSIRDFHRIKKELRDLGILFSALADERIDFHISRATAGRFAGLGAQLQVVHDDYVGKHMSGEINYEEATVTLEPELRANIESVLSLLKG